MFYKPCLLRTQRSQQAEEAEAEGGTEEEEIGQGTILKWILMSPEAILLLLYHLIIPRFLVHIFLTAILT